jgi:hypothetical protein
VGLQEGAPADEDTDAAWSANADAITGLGIYRLGRAQSPASHNQSGLSLSLSFEGFRHDLDDTEVSAHRDSSWATRAAAV